MTKRWSRFCHKRRNQKVFRRNTLEINRLIVELETREKENANLRLREARIWLLLALLGTALVAVTAYLAYTFQRAKNIRQSLEAAVKVENLIKEQELVGINSMLEGQEKERKRIANELHDDLGQRLNAVKMGLEVSALLPNLAPFSQAEDLKPAAVREDGQIPIDEFVQPARCADDVHARADVEMIRVAEDDLRAHLAQLARVNRLHAALRAHGHEHRRVHHSVGRGQSSEPRLRVRVGLQKFKHSGEVLTQRHKDAKRNEAIYWSVETRRSLPSIRFT
jgi:hypothetical protein